VTFPAEEIRGGHMLSGLGVPDMRGGIGTPTLYTTDPARDPADNEFAVRVVLLEDDGGPSRAGDRAGLSYVSDVVGPDNLPFHDYAIEMAGEGIESRDLKRQAERHMEDRLKARGVPKVLKLPLNIQVDRERKTVTVSASGQEWTLRPGQWSGWTTFTFPVNWLVNRLNPVEGAARFYLLSVEPELNLYLAPLNFHPDFHPVPFSYPAGWASKLARRFGLFKTLGWAIDTWTMSAGLAGEKFTLSDLHATEEKYGQMMEHLLAESDDDLYVQIFTGPDRAGHMLWRLMDPGHPLYDSEVADRWGGALKEVYMQMDRIVGRAMNLLPEGSTLIVCSDHGFSSYRRGINYNTWLARKGFMTLASRDGGYGETKTLEDLFHGGTFFENVDWSRTKAYAMGLGEIYINLEGREPQGVVRPGDEYEQVRDAIVRGLESFVDPATGQHPVHRVYRREEIYSRFNAAIVPDLRASNNLGYRVEWQTALGGFTPEIVSDNLKLWSGDHCSLDPQFVKGILFINRPLQLRDPGIVDLAPTMLDILGVPPPSGLDGVSLLSHSRVARR
ncbi:MAG: alkaline phosphatase family protein, partial [Acidobacteriota bacterium]